MVTQDGVVILDESNITGQTVEIGPDDSLIIVAQLQDGQLIVGWPVEVFSNLRSPYALDSNYYIRRMAYRKAEKSEAQFMMLLSHDANELLGSRASLVRENLYNYIRFIACCTNMHAKYQCMFLRRLICYQPLLKTWDLII